MDETDDSYSDESFVLYQMSAKINLSKIQDKAPKKMHLIANLPYRLKQYQSHHKYLRVQLDICADVNIMPRSVYLMMFNDPEVKQLAPSDISLRVYTDHQVHILGKCKFYMLLPDTKKPQAVTFYVASYEGSVLLSCTTLLALDLIQTRPRLDYLPPRAKLITSAADHPDITKKTAHQSKASVKSLPVKIVMKKSDIKEHYVDVFEGVGHFPGPPYHIQVNPNIPPKQTPVRPVPVHLKEAFKQELDKMLQAGHLKPVHEATPWINSYVIVEGQDKLSRLKLWICLDPKNLNVAVIREPWFSKTPDDIAHLLADACIIITTYCTKGFGHQALDEKLFILTMMSMIFKQRNLLIIFISYSKSLQSGPSERSVEQTHRKFQ